MSGLTSEQTATTTPFIQVLRLSNRICILRCGKQVGVRETKKTEKNEIIPVIGGMST